MCRRNPRCRNPDPLDCEWCERMAEEQADPDFQYSRAELDALADYAAAREHGGGRG